MCWLVLVGACGSVNGNEAPVDGSEADASVPTADANPCLGGGLVQLCLDALPRDELRVAAAVQIDTDKDSRCASFTPSNADWCVITATTIAIAPGATLAATGRRALVLAATEALVVEGTVDVSSHTKPRRVRGAGMGIGLCGGARQAQQQGGAGAGGSFRSKGGSGGGNPSPAQGTLPGGVVPLDKLRGGCSGAGGGVPDPNPAAEGGDGGGAVYLMAPMIRVAATGVINASGGGGDRALYDDFTGAAGGGSGGLIGLDGAQLQLAAGARLYANGGGGGEGTGCAVGMDSGATAGQDPLSPTVPAHGGHADPQGGDGGDGALSTGDGARGADGVRCPDGSFYGGGGGGGGGVGAIVLRGTVTDLGAQLSPPATAP